MFPKEKLIWVNFDSTITENSKSVKINLQKTILLRSSSPAFPDAQYFLCGLLFCFALSMLFQFQTFATSAGSETVFQYLLPLSPSII